MSDSIHTNWQGGPPPPGFQVFGTQPAGEATEQPPQPYGPPAGYGAPAGYGPPPVWAPPPAKKRSKVWVVLLSVVLAVVALGVVGAVFGAAEDGVVAGRKTIPRDVTLRTPPTIGNAKRMTSSFAKEVERESVTGMPAMQQPQVGLYGNGSKPRYYLFAGFGAEKTSTEMYREFKKGLGDTGTVGAAKSMPGGLTCAPVTISGLRGAACVWAGRNSNGGIMDYTKRDLAALAKVTVAARTYIEGG